MVTILAEKTPHRCGASEIRQNKPSALLVCGQSQKRVFLQHTYMPTLIHTYPHQHKHTPIHLNTHLHKYTPKYAHIQTHTYTHTHTYTQTPILTRNTHLCTPTHNYTCLNIHLQTQYIHTYTNTCLHETASKHKQPSRAGELKYRNIILNFNQKENNWIELHFPGRVVWISFLQLVEI